ncbi:MAG: hypothetical protein LBQ64_02550 [Bacteroidales bacterium]|jgi:pyruvate carboxylase|nr:hypothetical protein [Bacteroidales bacterium]
MKQKIQTRFTFMIVLGFFALTTFNSCDKTKKYDGTIWTAQYITSNIEFLNYSHKIETWIKYKITLSFIDNSVSIISKCEVTFIDTDIDPYSGDTIIQQSPPIQGTDRGKGTYTLSKKDIMINVKGSKGSKKELGSLWKGTIDKTTMTLSGVYDDKTMAFTKE